ncbi:hypothetical protein [Microcoleus sp. AR_TQ3_B6]|uniref:hypothetical protein n=1 Tax=Microcoleus sp. AR_TQ3_B6 TaxID=3055284 RepID=UPI002FD169BA
MVEKLLDRDLCTPTPRNRVFYEVKGINAELSGKNPVSASLILPRNRVFYEVKGINAELSEKTRFLPKPDRPPKQ